MTPNELDFLAVLVAIFSFVVAAVFFTATQTVRGSWITILGGGLLVSCIEAYAIYKRIY